MADFSVSDVASRVKGPEGISLSDMMNMSINAQKFRQAEKINPLLARQQEALTTEAEETLQPRIKQKKAESESAIYGANTAKLKQIIDASTIAVQEIQQLHKNPTYDGIVKMATDSINNSGQFLTNEDKQAAITKAIMGLNPKATKTELQAFIAQKQASILSAQAQAEKLYPTAYMQDTGQQIRPVVGGNPLFTGQEPTAPVGAPITKQLPTGTERIVTDPAEATRMGVPVGTKVLIGGGGGGQGIGGKPTPPTVSAMQPGQAESLQNRAKIASEDWSKTTQDATSATKNIGLLQLVKEYSNAAVTGSLTDSRQYLNKLASTFGIPGADITSATDTDLLNKVTSMLTQAGGNTDAARILSESANPNRHMTAEAIKKAANQLIGQEKLKLVKQAVMQQYQTDPEKYTKALTQFSQISDPNVLQFSSMSVEDQKRFKSSMTDSERKSFSKKLHALEVLDNKYKLGLM
jgi:hypothetical protein